MKLPVVWLRPMYTFPYAPCPMSSPWDHWMPPVQSSVEWRNMAAALACSDSTLPTPDAPIESASRRAAADTRAACWRASCEAPGL
eukprot:364053-Chlamydomonas_euryale.AAC.2